MKPIKILPHHATGIFEVFYLGWKPEEILSWYDDKQMEQNSVESVRRITSNPDQLVQIVDSYDEICRMCPRNKQEDNYDGNTETACDTYDTPNPDSGFIEVLGLDSIADGTPITARKFKELMRSTYVRLMAEPSYDPNGKKLPLRQILRIKNEVLYSNTINDNLFAFSSLTR